MTRFDINQLDLVLDVLINLVDADKDVHERLKEIIINEFLPELKTQQECTVDVEPVPEIIEVPIIEIPVRRRRGRPKKQVLFACA